MNRDFAKFNLDDKSYTFAYNSNSESLNGEGLIQMTNEPSNLLCSGFKPGYRVIGNYNDYNNDSVYFFSVNPTTGLSEIGLISSISNFVDTEDFESICDCNIKVILDEPLEGKEQQPHCNYITILSDCKENNCLNFSEFSPILDVEMNYKDGERLLYFTDNRNPVRYINLDDIQDYYIIGNPNDCQTEENTCLDCDKLRVFPLFETPCLKVDTVSQGGNLFSGSYEFMLAYCNEEGSELSNYYSLTNPLYIYDLDNNILTQPELSYETNLAIKLIVEDLDLLYGFYKVVSLEKNALNQESSFREVGVFNTDNNVVIYSNQKDRQRITLNEILTKRVIYEKAKGITSSSDRLMQYGLTRKKDINLQPVVNLMGAFAKWVTVTAKETIYKNPVLTAEAKSYMRDEVYPFSIKFITKEGYETPLFPFIPRPSVGDEEDVIWEGNPTGNFDIDSINEYNADCSSSGRTKKWQYYNTATVDIEQCLSSEGEEEVEIIEERNCIVSDNGEVKIIDSLLNGELIVQGDIDIVSLQDFINEGSVFDSGSSKVDLDNILSDPYLSEFCDPFEVSDCENTTEISSTIEVLNVENELIEKTPKTFPNDYERITKLPNCSRASQEVDQSFVDNFMLSSDIVYTSFSIPNGSCIQSLNMETITDPSSFLGVPTYFTNIGSTSMSGIIDSSKTISDSSHINSEFSSNLHKNANWYSMDFNGESEIIIDFSKISDCELSDDNSLGQNIRYSTYQNCNSTNSINSGIFSVASGLIVKLNRADYNSDNILVAFEAPFRFRNIVTNNSGGSPIDTYTITPPCGCFHLGKRSIEIESTKVTFSKINFFKVGTYTSTCTYFLPKVSDCAITPFKKGNFSYWESESLYPCNKDLYNSKLLENIDSSKIPTSIKQFFENYYVDSVDTSGNYILNDKANFMNKPIRHYKFPCNTTAPFMNKDFNYVDKDAFVYPIGFSISEEVISFFLDTALDNGLIDAETRASIIKYEIFRGDRRVDKSVLAKGLAYDMYAYSDINSNQRWYSNFPYNSLGRDVLHNIMHPFGNVGNKNYTFHSPDTHIRKIGLGDEIKVEGYQYGNSTGKFVEVNEHPEWVIMGQPAYTLAGTLAGLEVAFEVISYGGNVSVNGTTGGISAPAGVAAAAIAVAAQAIAAVHRAGQYRYQWLEIFRNLGKIHNFAYYYTSYGNYNYFKSTQGVGNSIRGLGTSAYIKPGDLRLNQEFNNSTIDINNLDRERSVYLSLGDYLLEYPVEYRIYDNYDNSKFTSSRFVDGTNLICTTGTGRDLSRKIASPYISIKQYVPNQYGDLNSITWLSTGKCGSLKNIESNCNPFFGGDIFISRFSLKRKIPLFSVDAMDQANLTPFAYSLYKNIESLQYFVDYEVNLDGPSIGGFLFPDKRTSIENMDCQNDTFYVKPPTKFYLYYYGIPNFLVESEINCNLRYGKPEPHENFYPNTTDFVNFTQEANVPIREPNTFFYNEVYSNAKTITNDAPIPTTFSNSESERTTFLNNSVIYSSSFKWNDYKPLNFYEFPLKYGDLVSLDGLESSQLIGRFENQTVLYNKLNSFSDATTVNNNLLGDGSLFAQRPYEFNKTDVGYAGSQHKALVSTEYGHFWTDAKRGDIFHLKPNAQGMSNITKGLKHWFKEHLPFKILKGGIDNLKNTDLDNQYLGLGIVLGWDNRHDRLFLTKLDYEITDAKKGQLRFENGEFLEGSQSVSLLNTDYFKPCHFTLAYKPELESWVSYYSFTPNYYINHDNYFQTGFNLEGSSLWSHLLTRRSYQVFQGVKEPWIVEYPLTNKNTNSYLNSLSYWMDTKVYRSKYDYSEFRGLGFNKAVVYNKSNNSGQLNLIPAEKNNLFQQSNYPIHNVNSIDILASQNDKKWSFNYIYNIVKDENNLQPIWMNDCTEILKHININSVNYINQWKDRIRGDYFLVRLTQDMHTQYNMTLKWLSDNRNYYE